MLLLSVFLALVVVGMTVFLLDSFFGGLDFASNLAIASHTVSIIKNRKLENGRFYDLGSARGGFALIIAKALPNMRVTGIDCSWVRDWIAKARSVFYKNLDFKKDDIFEAELTSADVVYIYLPQELMNDLEIKLKKELKPGAIVVSNKVNFPNWQPAEKVDKLFVYVKE